jgi:hypothetical protein
MGGIRQPVGAPGWLWVILAVAAMGFSLVHTVVDFGIILGSSSSRFGVHLMMHYNQVHSVPWL